MFHLPQTTTYSTYLARPRRVQRHGRRPRPAIPEGHLKTAQVSSLCGVSRRMLQWWDERGIIKPLICGHSRAYSVDQVRRCILLSDLRAKGLSLKACRRALRLTDLQPGDVVASLDAGKTWRRLRGCDHTAILGYLLNAPGPVLVTVVLEVQQ